MFKLGADAGLFSSFPPYSPESEEACRKGAPEKRLHGDTSLTR